MILSSLALNACQVQVTPRLPEAAPDRTVSTMTQMPSPTQSPQTTSGLPIAATPCATPPPDVLNVYTARSITAEDSGKSLILHQTDRFSVYLDDQLYPISELEVDPAGMLGKVSNGSVRGPNCYPMMFEAATEGSAVLRDRGFQLRIVIDNRAAVSTLPLH